MISDPIVLRDALLRCIRAFFHEHGFVEVETPIRLAIPCMELHIDAELSGDHFLRTSPEIFHKQLLANGYERIFELGKCFRQGERGALHHPEYTMLEWYRTATDYRGVLADTKALMDKIASTVGNGWTVADRWTELTVSDAFHQFAGWDPVEQYDADRFDLDMIECIEPAITSMGGAVVLIDYPAEAAALSRCKADRPQVAERWELYLNGIELANAYSELTDPVEQRRRFEECGRQRAAMGKLVYPISEPFLACLDRMPAAGGVALGIDRLLMLLAGADSLDAVIPFRD